MVALTIRSAGIGSQNACEFVALPPDEYFTRSEKKFSPPPGTPTATCQYVPPAWLLLIPTQANTRIPAAVAGTTLSGILKRCTTPDFIGRLPRIAARFSPGWTAIQGPTPLIDRSPFGSTESAFLRRYSPEFRRFDLVPCDARKLRVSASPRLLVKSS